MTPPAGASKTPTIHEALAAVMADVQSIGKGDTNQQQGYKFRGVDATMNAVGPAFREHGVCCVPVSATLETERYQTRNNAHMKGATVGVTFRFYGPAGDYIEAFAYGEGADTGDKAISKAHAVALRTVLLQTLCVPTGDPEPDGQSHERGAQPQPTPEPTPVVRPPDPRKRVDNLVARLMKNEWITPQQVASACETELPETATLDDLAKVLDKMTPEALHALSLTLETYGVNKKAQADT